MKKISKILAATLVSLSMLGGVAGAQAANNCTISGTGPGSNNTCTNTNNQTITVTCVNGVTTTNINAQNAVSGSVNVSGNTISGNATSGTAQNANALVNELASYCNAAPAAATSTTPQAGGRGAGTVAGAATGVTALPKTGVNDVLPAIAVAVTAAAGLVAASQLAVASYRRK